MRKIVKGILHTVVLKNLDRYFSEAQQWYKTTYNDKVYECPEDPENHVWYHDDELDVWYVNKPRSASRDIEDYRFPFNPITKTWTPFIKIADTDYERSYRCIIKNVDSDVAIESRSINWETLINGNVNYMTFRFDQRLTNELDEGKVSMSVIDDDNGIIYHNKHYGKVFKEQLYGIQYNET